MASALVQFVWRVWSLLRRVCPFLAPRLLQFASYPPRPIKLPPALPQELSSPPGITVVTPSFEQGRYIEQTIRSVLDQQYPNLEYVVVDGGSQDATVDILKRYSGRLARWSSERDEGQADAVRKGFSNTSGEIMAYLNSDDMLLPGSLASIAHFFLRHPEVDVVYGHRIIVDASGQEVNRWIIPEHDPKTLRWVDWVPQETLFWRRSAWERVGGIDPSFQFAMDWDLLLRFQEAGLVIKRLNRFLGAFRCHPNQKGETSLDTVGRREMELLRRKYLGRDVTTAELQVAVFGFILRHIVADWRWRLGFADMES
jgi:glycosyltransferase involved in cell wall biosynthesis